MDDKSLRDRLSQMSTCWTLLAEAHGGEESALARAQAALIERYQGAVYRYLLGILRSPDAADDVFQEFALRVVRGGFHKADPGKGKFRSYVKTSLVHLVRQYRGKQARQATAELTNPEDLSAAVEDEAASDAVFLDHWRKTLFDRAWETLQQHEKPDGPPYCRILRLRTEKPDLSTAQIAEAINAQLGGAPMGEPAVRKVLQRSRDMFTDALLDEIERSSGAQSIEDLEQEVIDIGLQAYCSKALRSRVARRQN